MCTQCPGGRGSQKKVLNSMDLELQLIGSCHGGAQNQMWAPWRSTKCSLSLSFSPDPTLFFSLQPHPVYY